MESTASSPAPYSAPFSHANPLSASSSPLVIEQFLLMTVGMADTVMVTSTGQAAVSGVSLVDNVNQLLLQVFAALSTGGAVVVSQYLGRREAENARHRRPAADLHGLCRLYRSDGAGPGLPAACARPALRQYRARRDGQRPGLLPGHLLWPIPSWRSIMRAPPSSAPWQQQGLHAQFPGGQHRKHHRERRPDLRL